MHMTNEFELLQNIFEGFSVNVNFLTWAVAAGIILDFATGIAKGYRADGRVSSSKLRNGMFKKSGIILVVIMSYGLSLLFNDAMHVIFNGVQAYYVYTELISVIENLVELGIPVPGVLRRILGEKKE